MVLTWDVKGIKDEDKICWIETDKKNDKGKSVKEMNPITDVLIWGSMFIGMDAITEKTYKEFHKRLIELEIITGKGMLTKESGDGKATYQESRQPTLEEIQLHIGLKTNASRMDSKKWGSSIRRIVKEEAEVRIKNMKNNTKEQSK